MSTLKTDQTYTVEQFIRLGRVNKVTFDAFSYKDLTSNGTEVSILDVVNDYMDELKDQVVKVKFTDDQYRRYRFKPKLLCHDIYGNTEIYFVILLLNGIADVKEFDFNVVKMIPVDPLNTMLSAIFNAESKWMKLYNTDHGTN